MVSMSILSLVAYSALPSGGKLLKKYALGSAVEQVASEAAKARMQAVGQNKFMRLRFFEDSTYALEQSTNGTTYTQIGTKQKLPKGIQVTATQSPTFNRRGLAAVPTTISVSDGQQVKSVRVDLLGQAKIT